MNTQDDNTTKPLGYWLKAADRALAAEFARAFASEGATRRDWRLLNAVDGTVAPARPLPGHKLHRLIERGWISPEDDGFVLTPSGRAAKDRLGVLVDDIRSRVSEAVSDEALATTLDTLEKISAAFGEDEDSGFRERGHRGHRHGHRGHNGHRGHRGHRGRIHGHHGQDDHDGHRGHRGRGSAAAKLARFAQRSYERGFDAGFTRGRES